MNVILFFADMASPRTEAKWLQWYDETPSDCEADSDLGDDVSEHSTHNTDTEQSSDDEVYPVLSKQKSPDKIPRLFGKDETVWLKHKPPCIATKTKRENIVTKLPLVCWV